MFKDFQQDRHFCLELRVEDTLAGTLICVPLLGCFVYSASRIGTGQYAAVWESTISHSDRIRFGYPVVVLYIWPLIDPVS
jgi:hypothetical protein